MALYHKYRPDTFEKMQGSVIEELKGISLEKNHSFLFEGPSGSGKTTAARIIATSLGALDSDIKEINASDCNGIDDVRSIISDMDFVPLGKVRVYILDEFHMMSKNAQNALLKPIEDYPPHVYFFLLTSEPGNILSAIKSRCTVIKFRGLTNDELFSILTEVKKAESFRIPKILLEKIAGAAEGNARKALVLLESVASLPEEDRDSYLEVHGSGTDNKYIIDLCRALFSYSCLWSDISGILTSLKEQKEDAEKIRRTVLGYGQAILLKKFDEKCYHVMSAFEKPMYDIGFPGVIMACYQAIRWNDAGRY